MDKIYSRPRIKFLKIKKESDNKNLFVQVVIIIIIALLTAKLIINAITPIIDKNCSYIAKNISTRISNEQAAIVMSKYKYEDLCTITKDTNGNISMINANIIPINEIISEITIRIQEELNKQENDSIKIKLGSFTGIRMLAGRGPDVKIKLSTIGNLDTELKSEFISSGINQTIHKIYLQVNCNVDVLTPFSTKEETITNQILLAESVIVGTTPNTYYNFDTANEDIALEAMQ